MLTRPQDDLPDVPVLGHDLVLQLVESIQDVLVGLPLVLQLQHPVVESLQKTEAKLLEGLGVVQVEVLRTWEGCPADEQQDFFDGGVGIGLQSKRVRLLIDSKGLHSTEEALLLLTQQHQVSIPALPRFFLLTV